ncbi:hypothetical protein D3C87_1387900 [compost metagenome]
MSSHSHDTQALPFANVREQKKMLLRDQPGERPADRMTAGGPKTGGKFQNVAAILERAVDGLQTQSTKRQGSGLVDHQRSQVSQLFKKRRAADQNPVTSRYRHPGNGRGWRR